MSAELKSIENRQEVEADNRAVMEHVITGVPLDPAVARRVQERARAIRQETYAKHGILNVVIELIHETRDEA